MSSITLKTFAVIKTTKVSSSGIDAGTILIIKGKDLKGWCRDRWPSGIEYWPKNALWEKEDEESYEDIQCSILKVESKEMCEEFVKNYSETPKETLDINQACVTEEQYTQLKAEICDLREELQQLRFELKSWRDACLPNFAVKSKLIQVANHEGWYISIDFLSLCTVYGQNETGFRKLFVKQFSDKNGIYFPGLSWNTLSAQDKEKIEDLMALFVLHCRALVSRDGSTVKSNYEQDLYSKIHKSLVTHFNQRNYRNGIKEKGGKTGSKKRKLTKKEAVNFEALQRVEESIRVQNISLDMSCSSEIDLDDLQEVPSVLLNKMTS